MLFRSRHSRIENTGIFAGYGQRRVAARTAAEVRIRAGLQAMPLDPIEAAIVDGADGWQRLRHVVLPQLQPLIIFVATIALMDHFREFDSVMVMTAGGPGTSTETVMYLNYVVSFSEQALGRGAAMSVLAVVGVLLLLSPLIVMTYREHRETR